MSLASIGRLVLLMILSVGATGLAARTAALTAARQAASQEQGALCPPTPNAEKNVAAGFSP